MTDPEIKPGDPRPDVVHVVVHPDGTRQLRFAIPDGTPLPPPVRPSRARVVWSYAWRWLLALGALLAWRWL